MTLIHLEDLFTNTLNDLKANIGDGFDLPTQFEKDYAELRRKAKEEVSKNFDMTYFDGIRTYVGIREKIISCITQIGGMINDKRITTADELANEMTKLCSFKQ